jgi:hypothetical protein
VSAKSEGSVGSRIDIGSGAASGDVSAADKQGLIAKRI